MITATPGVLAVTTPSATVAISVSLLDQITFLFSAVSGVIIAVRFAVSPTLRASLLGETVIPVTKFGMSIGISISPVLAPHKSQVSVINPVEVAVGFFVTRQVLCG